MICPVFKARIILDIAYSRNMGGSWARDWENLFRHYDPGLVVVMVNLAVGEQIPFRLLSSMMSWAWVAWKWSLIMLKMLPNGAVS